MQIKILNQAFNIQGVHDEVYIQQVASHVENKMTQLQQLTNTVDSHRLALLAALHITDEYFQLREEFHQMDQFVGKKSAEYLQILDRLTEQTPD